MVPKTMEMILAYGLLAVVCLVLFAITGFIASGAFKCYRCRLRIASVKAGDTRHFSGRRIDELGDDSRYARHNVCCPASTIFADATG